MLWLQGAENMKEQPKTTEKKKIKHSFCSHCSSRSPRVSLWLAPCLCLCHRHKQTNPLSQIKAVFVLAWIEMWMTGQSSTHSPMTHMMLPWEAIRKHAGSICKVSLYEHRCTQVRMLVHSQISMHTCSKCTHGNQILGNKTCVPPQYPAGCKLFNF